MEVCCPAVLILTLFQSNSYQVNVREYSPGISYVENEDYQLTYIIKLVLAKCVKRR